MTGLTRTGRSRKLELLEADDIRRTGGSRLRVALFKILRGIFFVRDRGRFFEEFATHTACFATHSPQSSPVDNTGDRTVRALAPHSCSWVLRSVKRSFFPRLWVELHLEIAEICECTREIVEERVQNGRARLAELLSVEFPDDLNPVTAPAAAVEAADANVVTAV